MIFHSELELSAFAEHLGKTLELDPNRALVFELKGDVGAGKTTFTRALAKGLGIEEPVTSPSFTISKRYAFSGGELTHYDFYRLPDPGLMADDLEESLETPNSVVVVEWADSVKNLLPKTHQTISFKTLGETERELTFENLPVPPEKLYEDFRS